jgi:hypothetical protein
MLPGSAIIVSVYQFQPVMHLLQDSGYTEYQVLSISHFKLIASLEEAPFMDTVLI